MAHTREVFMNKSFMIVILLAGHLVFPVASEGQGEAYDFPLTNPLAATVVGTPKAYEADLPKHIPVEIWELEVFPDRLIPDILWYDQKLRYS